MDRPGIKCQICGRRMEPERDEEKRRWRFVCLKCGAVSPTRDGRAQAAEAAKTYDAVERASKWPVVCPYYIGARWKYMDIDCEPPVVDARITRTTFEDIRDLKRHMARFCRSCWKECPLARMCTEKYEKLPE